MAVIMMGILIWRFFVVEKITISLPATLIPIVKYITLSMKGSLAKKSTASQEDILVMTTVAGGFKVALYEGDVLTPALHIVQHYRVPLLYLGDSGC